MIKDVSLGKDSQFFDINIHFIREFERNALFLQKQHIKIWQNDFFYMQPPRLHASPQLPAFSFPHQ